MADAVVRTSRQSDSPDVANLRHDLLTPVNHLMGYSEMLAEDLGDRGELECAKLAVAINAAAKDALFLIQQALPSGEGSNLQWFESLGPVIRGPVDTIIQLVDTIRSESREPLRTDIEDDLKKIVVAAGRLETSLPQVEFIHPSPILLSRDKNENEDGQTANLEETPRSQSAGRPAASGYLLVVDDDDANRDVLTRRLERDGYRVAQAEGGGKALEMISAENFDMVLLDVMMPEIDGFEVLKRLKASERADQASVIMLSAMNEVQSAVRCIELGADDYLTKPYNPVLLRARIGASLERKRLRDIERRTAELLRATLLEIEEEKRKSEALLRNILPAKICEELRAAGQVTPKYFDDVSIVFTDFVAFALSTEDFAADELVAMLHDYFTRFDGIVKRYGLEKLKTIGDSYMFMGGLPPRNPSHAIDAILASMEMIRVVEELRASNTDGWRIRIGVHVGPVIAGVVGIDKFAFDVWGETVNYGKRLESSCEPGRINVSERCYSRIKDFFECEFRGKILTKEQRESEMYFVKGIRAKLMEESSGTPPPLFLRRYRTYFDHELPSFPAFLGHPE
jgi:adenylate cyclase